MEFHPPFWLRIVVGSVYSILLIWFTWSMIKFYQMRNSYSIKARLPFFCLFLAGCYVVYAYENAVLLSVDRPFPGDCVYMMMTLWVPPNLMVLIFFLRGLRLLFKFEIYSHLSRFRGHKNHSQFGQNLFSGPCCSGAWFLRHRKLVHPKKIAIVVIFMSFIYIGMALFSSLLLYPKCQAGALNLTDIFFLSQLSLFVPLIYKYYYHKNDPFGIRNEFRLATIAGVLTQGMVIVLKEIFPHLHHTADSIINCFAMPVFFTLTIAYPLHRAHSLGIRAPAEIRQNSSESVELSISSMPDLMVIEECIDYLIRFCQKEFCSENPIFWRAVRDYHRKFDALLDNNIHNKNNFLKPDVEKKKRHGKKKRLRITVDGKTLTEAAINTNITTPKGKATVIGLYGDCKKIYDEFISDQAPLQINIPAEIVQDITSVIMNDQNDPTADKSAAEILKVLNVFDSAQTQIYRVMQHDTFPRFLKSREMNGFIKSANIKIKIERSSKSLGKPSYHDSSSQNTTVLNLSPSSNILRGSSSKINTTILNLSPSSNTMRSSSKEYFH